MPDADATLEAIFEEHAALVEATRTRLRAGIAELATALGDALDAGGKLLVFGNGGSAADAQHFAAELVGRFSRQRPGLPAIALTSDSSVVTAIANDFGYPEVFARQVEAFCTTRDVVVGISTSGNSESVSLGLRRARELGFRTWALTGADGGAAARVAEHALRVPSDVTARIQEMHITIIHVVSELVDGRVAD